MSIKVANEKSNNSIQLNNYNQSNNNTKFASPMTSGSNL